MNDKKIQEFIRSFVKAINESNAAIFAGAGLSRPAGYVDWKELLRDIAEGLGLDVDKETDLIALAQYHVNEYGNRGHINAALLENFTRNIDTTENHKILANLPLKTYWTTNYDKLIEKSLQENNKIVDAKIEPENISNTIPNTDAIVYKMHGDISLSHKAVLTKDDYEGYEKERKLYSTALKGDLVSKTFLFIGFSFDDPNLTYILSRIRILLDENARNHYCFMKKVKRDAFDSEKDFNYAEVKQELKIKDLKRYNITVLLVDEYEEITEILKIIDYLVKIKNVFISGSATEYGDWGETRAFEFSSALSKTLIKNDYNIVSGFGLGIGSCIVSGALEELYNRRVKNIDDRLKSWPFPQSTVGKIPLESLYTKRREEMLSNVGISVFIFGNKIDKASGEIQGAKGMEEEFDIAIKNEVIPIPVGATGYTTLKLWERVMNNYECLVNIESLKPLYEQLGDKTKTNEELIFCITEIIKGIINFKTKREFVHGA
ncbi:hypothetical protein BG31_05940 [Bacillus subtilis subsp. subtilis]|uniref:NAD(+) hydrolase ThsA n=1 Tax=Bacillus halotolerans TaxID=260554 RepID=A0A9Q6A9R4_9BACI|nr:MULTISPECIES: SIR2 family protein [Bacillus subtilis group]OTQ88897.1 hypothetical protein BG31_05940 [Bacillus subtilis subsp. subtilis]PLS07611.1 hypothetical protein CUU63_09945 [Bacillus halotolerans]